MRILVVEDDEKVGGFVEQGLREEGFEVDRARDGDQALAKTREAGFDLILLDYMLPKRSGLQVALAFRAAGGRTPILMLTARDAPEDIGSGRDAGIDDFMSKPFRFDELLHRVRSLLPPTRASSTA